MTNEERLDEFNHNAIIIPKGATNGEVIKAIFPNIDSINFSCELEWWDKEYKENDAELEEEYKESDAER